MRLEKGRPGAVDEQRGKGSSHAVPREGGQFFTNYARFYFTGNTSPGGSGNASRFGLLKTQVLAQNTYLFQHVLVLANGYLRV